MIAHFRTTSSRVPDAGPRSPRLARSVWVIALVAFMPAPSGLAAPSGSIRWVERDGGLVVEVSSLDSETLDLLRRADLDGEGWAKVFPVFASPSGEPLGRDARPMLGDYRLEGDTVRFTPRFPLMANVLYRAEFDLARVPGGAGARRLRLSGTWEREADPGPPTVTVTRIDPSAEVLPANLLRFYLHFSGPMSQGHAYEHVRLLNDKGQPIELPFLELGEELWDTRGRRLTLLIDPGRIKTDLVPNRQVGPVLEAGRSYTLVIDPSWPDAQGRPLKSGARKTFRTSEPDHSSPSPKSWGLSLPSAGTRGALDIDLKGAIDRPQAERLIAIHDGSGPVAGTACVTESDTHFRFIPEAPWRPGPHSVVVSTVLEDPSGNSIERPFEVDLFQVDPPQAASRTVVIGFEIPQAGR